MVKFPFFDSSLLILSHQQRVEMGENKVNGEVALIDLVVRLGFGWLFGGLHVDELASQNTLIQSNPYNIMGWRVGKY